MGKFLRNLFLMCSLILHHHTASANLGMPPAPLPPNTWDHNLYYEWTGVWNEQASRPFLACSKNSSNNQWRLVRVNDNYSISNGFSSFDECKRSNQEARPGHLCLPSSEYRGKYFIKRLSDNKKIGNYFSNQDNCLSMITQVKKQMICMPSDSYAGKYYLYSLTTNKMVKQHYYNDAGSCNSALSMAYSGYMCLPSNSYVGKYFLEALDGQSLSSRSRPYFSNIESCNSSIVSIYSNHICAESSQYPGKALILNLENGKRVGNYYSNLSQCQSHLQAGRKKHVCSPSAYYAGKFVAFNLRTGNPMGNSIYFNDGASCMNSVQNMASDFICLPSSSRPGNFYLKDWVNNTVRNVYYDTQTQCLTSMEPWITYERQQCLQQYQLSQFSLDQLNQLGNFLGVSEVQ